MKRKLKKKYKIIILIIILVILISTSLIISIINPFLSLKINQKEITLEVNGEYVDEYKALHFGKDVTNKVKIDSNVDTTKLGTYTVTYTIKALLSTKTETRTINIIDKTSPILTLKGDSYTIDLNSKYVEKGFEVKDNYDNLKEEDVQIEGTVDTTKEGKYKLTYTVKDSSNNIATQTREITVKKRDTWYSSIVSGPTYIDGILIVNKKYSIPSTFRSDLENEALEHLKQLQAEGSKLGYNVRTISGYRSYASQDIIYNNYVRKNGQAVADTFSARPGHSEHQTGLAYDVGQLLKSYGNTESGKWLLNNCSKYGFIVRYPKGKENITGYSYEPWHIRYVGVDVATKIMNKNITLEEYLGV